ELRRHDVKPLAYVLADPMQCIAATRTAMILNVDYDLDARQMGGKRSTVHPALGASIGPRDRIGDLGLGLCARCTLLDVLKPEQHLIFRQALGTSAKPVTLQLLDDLTQPIVLRPLGDQHRLERVSII